MAALRLLAVLFLAIAIASVYGKKNDRARGRDAGTEVTGAEVNVDKKGSDSDSHSESKEKTDKSNEKAGKAKKGRGSSEDEDDVENAAKDEEVSGGGKRGGEGHGNGQGGQGAAHSAKGKGDGQQERGHKGKGKPKGSGQQNDGETAPKRGNNGQTGIDESGNAADDEGGKKNRRGKNIWRKIANFFGFGNADEAEQADVESEKDHGRKNFHNRIVMKVLHQLKAFAEESERSLSDAEVAALKVKVETVVAGAGTHKDKLHRVIRILAESFGYDADKLEGLVAEMKERMKNKFKAALADKPALELRPEFVDTVFAYMEENDDETDVYHMVAKEVNFDTAKLAALGELGQRIEAEMQEEEGGELKREMQTLIRNDQSATEVVRSIALKAVEEDGATNSAEFSSRIKELRRLPNHGNVVEELLKAGGMRKMAASLAEASDGIAGVEAPQDRSQSDNRDNEHRASDVSSAGANSNRGAIQTTSNRGEKPSTDNRGEKTVGEKRGEKPSDGNRGEKPAADGRGEKPAVRSENAGESAPADNSRSTSRGRGNSRGNSEAASPAVVETSARGGSRTGEVKTETRSGRVEKTATSSRRVGARKTNARRPSRRPASRRGSRKEARATRDRAGERQTAKVSADVRQAPSSRASARASSRH